MARSRCWRKALLCFASAVLCCFVPSSAHGQGIVTTVGEDLAGAAITTYTVDHILKDVDEKVAQWESNAGVVANNTALNVVGQIAADASRLRVDLNHDMGNQVQSLSNDAQARVLELVKATNDFEQKLANDVDLIKDESVVDIRRILYNVPFLSDEGFFVQRIDGTTVPTNEGISHTITVEGVGFGFASEDIQGKSYLNIQNNPDRGPLRVDGAATKANVTAFTFPSATFLGIRPNNAPKSITADVILDLTERKRVWIFFHKTVNSHHDIPISITMLPEIGGTVEVTVTAPAYKWVDQPSLTISQTKTTPNGNSDHGNHFWTQWDISTPVNPHSPPREGDQRISRADVTSLIESNPGCSNFNNHSISVSPDGTHATLTWENWGWPVTITFSAFVQEWKHVGDTTSTSSPVQFPLGGNFELHLPENFTHASILVKRYDGRTETLDLSRSTGIDVPPIPNPAGQLISYVGNYPTASDVVYTFASLQPIKIEAAYTKRGLALVHLPASFKNHQ